jgi:chromosome segregation and condensation protein ScpB
VGEVMTANQSNCPLMILAALTINQPMTQQELTETLAGKYGKRTIQGHLREMRAAGKVEAVCRIGKMTEPRYRVKVR